MSRRKPILWWQQPEAVWLDLRPHCRVEPGRQISREADQPEPGIGLAVDEECLGALRVLTLAFHRGSAGEWRA
jgi:hypothetical protein